MALQILPCEEFQGWVETTIKQPIERKITKTQQQCKKKKCRKLCLCCNKWWCWLVIIALTIVEIIFVVVLEAIVFAICVGVNAILDVLGRTLQRVACVVIDFGTSLFGASNSSQRIDHIFVLMLENRSFDHMLGLSRIQGFDAETNAATTINGLTGNESNRSDPHDLTSRRIVASGPAEFAIAGTPLDDDPPHEFQDVFHQLTGTALAGSLWLNAYPPPTNDGFAQAYTSGQRNPRNPDVVMHCFLPEQLPVIVRLAKEFAICDNWFSSMPGPTWPNRYFVHGASSVGLDDSPTTQMIAGSMLFGLAYANGSIFDRLDSACLNWEIFSGDQTPQVASIAGVTQAEASGRLRKLDQFANALRDTDYSPSYVFIEPNYGDVANDYACGNCQHPLDDVTRGESLIKDVYEAIRNSPHWDHSLLIVTWDEHGGFYDHVPPPVAVAPGDPPLPLLNRWGFDFTRLGPRVPAIIVSPLIPRNRIDHRVYDHSSVPATVERNFGLDPLTKRDATATDLLSLLSLPSPRTDAPIALPTPADSGLQCRYGNIVARDGRAGGSQRRSARSNDRTAEEISPDLRGFLHVAFLRHYEIVKHERRSVRREVIDNYQRIQSKGEANAYIESVQRIVEVKRPHELTRPRLQLVEDDGDTQRDGVDKSTVET